ncbi:ATP-binding protein [Nostoc sp. CHAB 5844]|nr:ATP-binding protein [Nostoc sp. CHAB 5844]
MTFELERLTSSQVINVERTILCSLGVSAVMCLSAPFFFHTDKLSTGMLLGAGTVCAGLFGVSAQISESKEKVYKSLQEADLKALKQHLQGDAAYDYVTTAIAAKRRVAAYVNRLPEHERPRWIAEYGLQGLVTLPQPPARQLSPRPGIPNPDIASIDEDIVQQVVNPGALQVLGAIAQSYPEYIRLDGAWLDQLCDAAVNHDMTKRANHHFYISGGTQSGKSTLAGVIVNKIAAKSQSPAVVFGSDPKDEVTRWLCRFTLKFDGMAKLANWITFATQQIDQQKKRVAVVGGSCVGVPELFMLQDEVDSVYGGGKGLPGMVTPETAKDLQGFWNYIIKFTAGLKGHGIFMGQSPLSGETGFSRPSLKNVCFLALGQTSAYILEHPQDFVNVKKDVLEMLRQACELLDKASVRYALVIPTRGNPFIALIPEFDIQGMEQKQQPLDESSADNSKGVDVDWYEEIKLWFQQLGRKPSYQEIKLKWQELTGQELSEKGVTLLLEHLGFPHEEN